MYFLGRSLFVVIKNVEGFSRGFFFLERNANESTVCDSIFIVCVILWKGNVDGTVRKKNLDCAVFDCEILYASIKKNVASLAQNQNALQCTFEKKIIKK